jgi:hypothetical protein
MPADLNRRSLLAHSRRISVATYDPPQPPWKHDVVGVLDFLLASVASGLLLPEAFGNQPAVRLVVTPTSMHTEFFSLGTWLTFLMIAPVAAYFVRLGHTGGTVFRRVFGMKRARKTS